MQYQLHDAQVTMELQKIEISRLQEGMNAALRLQF